MRYLLPLLLAGCATTQPAVEIREVEVPTPVPCLTAEQYAELAGRMPPQVRALLNGNAGHDLPIIAGSALDLRAYAGDLLGVLLECSAD